MDSSSIIRKTPDDLRVAPNLVDYETERRNFSWEAISRDLACGPQGAVNLAWLAADRHAAGGTREKTAFRFLAEGAPVRTMNYGELSALATRFCNVLRGLGVGKGERLFILTGRIPELYVALLGSLRNGTVVSPLFSAFGPEPIAMRMNLGAAAVLVTTDALYERKVAKWRDRVPTLRHVLLVAEDGSVTNIPHTLDLATLLAKASDAGEITPTTAEDLALLHFTSGTTGTPKGAVHVHEAVATHHVTGRLALDLHPDDIFWCTADPGWVTGTSLRHPRAACRMVSPASSTRAISTRSAGTRSWKTKVSVWYTAPTAIRMMMKAGPALRAE